MAERWVYAAGIGFMLALTEILFLSIRNKKAIIAAAVCLASFFGIFTYLRNDIYKDPIALWTDAAKKSPQKLRPYTNLCAYYGYRKEVDMAIAMCKIAINKGSNKIETYINLAGAYYLKNDINNAEAILLSIADKIKAAGADDKAIEVFNYNLGSVYKGKREYRRAIEEYEKVLKTSPGSPAALGLIGECYQQLGIDDKAKEYYSLATKGIPQNAEDYLMLAKSFLRLGENKRGLESLNNAVITDPLNVNVRNEIATIFLEGGNPEAAYKHFSVMTKLSPNLFSAYTGMGKSMLARGNLREARKHFNKALSLLPPGSSERKELLELLEKTKG
ncbi:MAG: tetratricopeptide repeat protein [Nitrospirae bacterium]|nr:tetratricopeptide repeat protein [Nitrospirota bacterium]